VAPVPGSSFYRDPRNGAQQVRFAFCKKPETLDAAAGKLKKLAESLDGAGGIRSIQRRVR
jgi:aspartate/methionine/tyrosine aminotransferase